MFETTQAKIASGFLALQSLTVLAVIIIVAVSFSDVTKALGADGQTRALLLKMLIPYLLLVIFNFITVFDLNCTVMGNCGIWAWLKTILIVLGAIGSVIVTILLYLNMRKLANTAKNLAKAKKQDHESKEVTEGFKDFVY